MPSSIKISKESFRAFRHRNYLIYWVTMLVSMTGTWMQSVAVAWLVLTLSSSAVVLGIVNALNFLPSLFLSLFAGVLIDRLSKRKILILTQSLEAIQAIVFWWLVWSKSIVLWEIYVLTFILGTINAFDQPARQAFVTEMVPDEDVTNAIGLNSLLFNAARTLGPMVAGVAIAAMGMAPSFFLNAISFLFVIVGFLFMKKEQLRVSMAPIRRSLFQDLKEGFIFIAQTPLIVALIIALFFAGIFGYNFTTIIPLLAKFVLHGSSRTLGVLSSAMGAGSMVGALLMSGLARPSKRVLYAAAFLFGFCEVLMVFSPHYFLLALLVGLMGLTGIIYLVSTNAMLQLGSPPHLRTRVISVYVLLLVGVTPIGAFFTGYLADRIGVLNTIFIEGLLCLLGVFLSLLYLRKKQMFTFYGNVRLGDSIINALGFHKEL